MKISKITLILLSLLSLNSLNAKIYPDGTETKNVFDVGILLARVGHDGLSSEEKIAKEGNLHLLTIISELKNFINDEEAVIVSTPLLRGLFYAASGNIKNKINSENFKNELQKLNERKRKEGKEELTIKEFKDYYIETDKKYKDTLQKLFTDKKANWSIFGTKDAEFVVLIPGSKYPDIATFGKKGLPFIGLKDLSALHYLNSGDNSDEVWKALEYQKSKIIPEQRGKINIDSLLDIFVDHKTIEKRIYVTGHGTPEQIANLSISDYQKLRNKLNEIGCSFFYVASCYGGGVGFKAMTAVSKGNALNNAASLSSKEFIEVLEGVPGYAISGTKSKTDKFFNRINNFFKEYSLEKIKKSAEKAEELEKIKDSHLFASIFEYFIKEYKTNLPVFRFPGDKKINLLKIGVLGETKFSEIGKKKREEIMKEQKRRKGLKRLKLIQLKEMLKKLDDEDKELKQEKEKVIKVIRFTKLHDKEKDFERDLERVKNKLKEIDKKEKILVDEMKKIKQLLLKIIRKEE